MGGLSYQFDHLHLITPDIEGTKDWYCNVLGAVVTTKVGLEGRIVYYMDLGGTTLILIERGLPDENPLKATLRTREGLDHFGMKVNDLDAAIHDLSSKGVRIHQPITPIREGLRIAYISGPDEVRIELVERRPL